MTNIIEIVNDMFSNNIFSFVILLIIVILMESSVKQQQNIPSVFCYFLVMLQEITS
jgi:glycerol uptake facilitator-like aquaporin